MTRKDPVRDFLKRRGCPAHVVEGGLEGLLEAWEKTASAVARGYGLGLDDYLNDVDGREILEAALRAAESSQRNALLPRLEAADRMIRGHLKPPGPCLWGENEALERDWTPERNWWYFRRPRGLK
jgi:hypothetical protein